MATYYQISDATTGTHVGERNRFERFDEAVRAAEELDEIGMDCSVEAVDVASGRVTGCRWGRHTWGTWDDEDAR